MPKKPVTTNPKLQRQWDHRQQELQQQQRNLEQQKRELKLRQQQQLEKERQSPPQGFTLQHVIRDHKDVVTCISWSPDGSLLASASRDKTIRVWNKENSSFVAILQGHKGSVTSITWSPDGHLLASASKDRTIRVWNKENTSSFNKPSYYVLQGHTDSVTSVAWSPNSRFLASTSKDKTIRIWDTENKTIFTSLQCDVNIIANIAWSPDGRLLAFATNDNAVCLWEVESISPLPNNRTFTLSTGEGVHVVKVVSGYSSSFTFNQRSYLEHTEIQPIDWSPVSSALVSVDFGGQIILWNPIGGRFSPYIITGIAWSPDGSLLAVSLTDNTIYFWDTNTEQQIRRLDGHTDFISHLSFSFDNRFLTSKSYDGTVRLWNLDVWEEVRTLYESSSSSFLGADVVFHPSLPVLATSGELDHVIRIWQLDFETIRRGGSAIPNAHYSNAKVVLVGDSGVGKSGLGLVLAEQAWQPTESTHGRYVWTFEDKEVPLNNGGKETRQTLLWDLAGQPGYRLIHQLHLNEVSVALVVFDGSSETNPFAGVHHWERALRIAQEKQGGGAALLKKLLVAARIDRGGTGVSQVRINALKQELGFDGYFETSAKEGKGIEELRAAIAEAINWEKLPKVSSTVLFQTIKDFLLEQKKAGRLLSTEEDLYHTFLQLHADALQEQFDTCVGRLESQGLIRRLSFGNFILLQPELLDAYASALVNVVKDEPDGLGNIAEEKVLAGQFTLPEDERIHNREQEKLLLIAMVEDLLRYEIALRESADDGTYLIFPSQSTRENVDMPDPEEKTAVFSFEGPVLNIYATLTVRFSHSGQFRKKELWRNAITYEASVGGTCGILLRNIGEGRGELTVFFDKRASEQTRLQFEQYLSIHLQRRALPESIRRKPVFICSNCSFVVSEQLLRLRKERNCNWVNCPNCQTYISLLDPEETLMKEISPALQAMDRSADRQRDLATAQSILQGKINTRDFDVFLCYTGLDKAPVKEIGEQLKERGILPWLDEWELRPGIPWQRLLEEQIGNIKSAAIFVGKNGRGPWQQLEIEAFLREFAKRNCPVIPVLLATAPKKSQPSLPIFLSGMTWVDFRKRNSDPLERLIWGITGQRPLDSF